MSAADAGAWCASMMPCFQPGSPNQHELHPSPCLHRLQRPRPGPPAGGLAAAGLDGATALACTDRDGLTGRSSTEGLHGRGLDPVVGVDLAVFDDDGDLRTQVGDASSCWPTNNNGAGDPGALCLSPMRMPAPRAKPVERCPLPLRSAGFPHPAPGDPQAGADRAGRPGLRRRTCHGAGATCVPAPCSNAGSMLCRPEPSPPRWLASSARPGNRSVPPTRCGCSSWPPNMACRPCSATPCAMWPRTGRPPRTCWTPPGP